MATLRERIERAVQIDPESGCWEWQRAHDGEGYGFIKVSGRQLRAHRVSYELHVGAIPDGLPLDHLCRNTSCVNPEHLEPVTHAENMRRAPTTLAAINAAKTHCPKGHSYDEYGYVWQGRRYCRECRRVRHLAWLNANREHARQWRRDYEQRRREAQRP